MVDQSKISPEEALGALIVLRRQMVACRQSPDGGMHTPPSDAELVLDATGECLASLTERVAQLEVLARGFMAVDGAAPAIRPAAE